jgi:two-component system response regulator YesN
MVPAVQLSRLRLLCRLTAAGLLENNGFILPAEDRSLNKRTVVEQVKAYIESNYREHLRIDDLARLAAVSRTALAVTFKQETGLSIWGYVHRVRMLKAREYLLSGSYKMYEIASMVGYDDRKYFSELFKDHYGQNPLEYKKAMEES